MKHAKLSVGRENFIKWIEARNRVEPLFFRVNEELYIVRCEYFPEQEYGNAQLSFVGIHEDKYNFEIDFCDELDEVVSPQFPEDEILGFLNIVKVDDNNIDLYYSILTKDFEKIIDTYLRDAPKSWEFTLVLDEVEIISTEGDNKPPFNIKSDAINLSENQVTKGNQLSLRNAVIPNERKWDRYAIERYNAGDTVKQIRKGIKDKHLGEVCVQAIYNRFTVLRETNPGILVYHRQDFKEEK